MLGKVFWGLVILLFVSVLVIPFVPPSYYANDAEAQYYENESEVGGDGMELDFKKAAAERTSQKVSAQRGVPEAIAAANSFSPCLQINPA